MSSTIAVNGESDSNNGGKPPLYSLVCVRRASHINWSCVLDRLVLLSDLLSPADPIPTEGGGLVASIAQKYERGAEELLQLQILRATNELNWAHSTTGMTALHTMCFWRPGAEIIGRYLTLAPEIVWKKTNNGSTALHLACSNAFRVAGVEVVKLLLEAAGKAQRNMGGDAKSIFALQETRDSNWTALHCAANSDAPLAVLEALLDVAPSAANATDKCGKTPLQLLTENYELLIGRYLDAAGGSSTDGVKEQTDDTALSWKAYNEPLHHFWQKASLLIRVSSSFQLSGDHEAIADCSMQALSSTKRIPIVQAALSMPSSSPCPQLLLRLILLSFPHQLRHNKVASVTSLHYALRSLETNDDTSLNHCIMRRRATRELLQAYPLAIMREDYKDEVFPHIIGLFSLVGEESYHGLPSEDCSAALDNVFDVLRCKPELFLFQ